MKEGEWKDKRNQAKRRLESALNTITITQELGVLIGAEDDYCNILKFNMGNLLSFFDERSVVSRVRFVEGAKDE